MRRWNGWGDESNNMALPKSAYAMLAELLGESQPLADASLESVLAQVPPSRLKQSHPLIDTDPEVRLRHARGQSLPDWLAMRSGEFGFFPDGVAFVQTSQQVAELLQLASAQDWLVIPYGGGTSVVGHITTPQADKPILVLSLEHMNRLLDFDEQSQIATFGAGTNGPALEAQLAAKGYTLGHFPQSWELSSVGGWVVTRSSGQQSLGYGRIEQLFAGGKVETFAGSWDIGNLPASAAGMDLREILMGSEGRIGVLTEVKLRVSKLPEVERFFVAFGSDWQSAYNAVCELVQSKVPLNMLRLSNPTETFTGMRLSVAEEHIGKLDKILKWLGAGEDKCMLTYGISGSALQVKQYQKQLKKIFKRHKIVRVASAILGEKWRHGRFKFPYLRHPLWEMGYAVDTFETALNWSLVNDYIQDAEQSVREALADEGERVHVFTHLSHVYSQGSSAYTTYLFRVGKDYQSTLLRWQKLKAAASAAIVRHGGTISHQHGVGRDHAPYLQAEKGAQGMAVMRSIVEHFDSQARLNPDVLISQEHRQAHHD